jgi:hypothetical protein
MSQRLPQTTPFYTADFQDYALDFIAYPRFSGFEVFPAARP